MTTFQDVKSVFHYIGDWFGSVGDSLNGWPWPLAKLASPFWYFRSLFYWADWVWDGLDDWLNYINSLWTWAGEFTTWVENRFWSVTNQILSWADIQGKIAYGLGIAYLDWYYLRLKINQSIASTLGLSEFTWDALISRIRDTLGGFLDLNWLFTAKFPWINASISDMWNEIVSGSWGNIIYYFIGGFDVNLHTIATWYVTKRDVTDAWFDTTRLNLEADVAWLKANISVEGIKNNLVGWLVERLDAGW